MRWLSIGVAVLLANAANIRAAPEDRCADHVRSGDAAIRQLVHNGCDRSVTFRALAGRVGELHGIVYVQPVRHIRNGLQAALQFSMITTPDARYLRVLLAVHTSDDRTIALIGHELQHAIEALQDPSVVNEATMRELFERLKVTGMITRPNGEYETEAAIKAGIQIAGELAARTSPGDTTPTLAVRVRDDPHLPNRTVQSGLKHLPCGTCRERNTSLSFLQRLTERWRQWRGGRTGPILAGWPSSLRLIPVTSPTSNGPSSAPSCPSHRAGMTGVGARGKRTVLYSTASSGS